MSIHITGHRHPVWHPADRPTQGGRVKGGVQCPKLISQQSGLVEEYVKTGIESLQITYQQE